MAVLNFRTAFTGTTPVRSAVFRPQGGPKQFEFEVEIEGSDATWVPYKLTEAGGKSVALISAARSISDGEADACGKEVIAPGGLYVEVTPAGGSGTISIAISQGGAEG